MPLFPILLAFSALTPSDGAPQAQPPRLVVVIGVDQMIPEQLDRLAPFFSGGYGRFVRHGLMYRRAMLEHANTETGPGYATLGTGCHPRTNGIVSNLWFNADGSGRTYCVADPEAQLVVGSDWPPSPSPGVSPRNFKVPALGDWMKRADAESQVVSLAGKDRAAIGLGGQAPELCLWWNKQNAGFASSSWYLEELPAWVEYWNRDLPGRIFESSWGQAGWKLDLPKGIESAGTGPDVREGESSRQLINSYFAAGRAETEPLKRRAYLGAAGYRSPLVDQLTIEMARLSVERYELGSDEHPDVLLLGLSGCDVTGHAFGPYSTEVTDLLLRTDVVLGEFFDYLDEAVGADAWSAVLTADHGVLMLPEEAVARGIQAARVTPSATDFGAAHELLVEQYGEDFIALMDETGIRLKAANMLAAKVDAAEVRAVLAELMKGVDWIERTFTREELEKGAASEDPWLRLAQNSFDPERSPDVVFQRRPWTLFGFPAGTSHGSPYPYDRSVPLVFLGPGIQSGRRFDAACTADVAPTVLSQLGLDVPTEMDGRVLELR